MTRLIAIRGKARSGKDTIAKHLFARHGFTRLAFADPLKRAAQAMFGLTEAQTWDDDLKEIVIPYWGLSPRQMFQLLGTEASKPVFGNDIWIKRWFLAYDTIKATDDVVIPDLRFDVEADMVRELGGIIIEVRRGNGLDGSTAQHVSENGLSILPDYVIDNNGSMEILEEQVDMVLRGEV